MPVDAGRDAAALRQAHPDRARFLILPAAFRLDFVDRQEAGGPAIHGHLIDVFPQILAVPSEARAPLDAFREPTSPDRRAAPAGRVGGWGLRVLDHAPRYLVRLSVGRSLRPWVEEIAKLPERGPEKGPGTFSGRFLPEFLIY